MSEIQPQLQIDPSTQHGNVVRSNGEWLPQRELTDLKGIDRPVFNINGREVIFHNRAENVQLDDTNGHLIEAVPLAVANTPYGIASAAAELMPDEDEGLRTLVSNIEAGHYDDKGLTFLDSITAAVSVTDDLKLRDRLDTDGYGLVLSALTGNEAAQTLLHAKLDVYHDAHEAHQARDLHDFRVWSAEHLADVEALKPEEVILVHSTQYPAEVSPDGAAILYPAFAKREDQYPRSSLHFTVNGEVTSHVFGNWSSQNRLIVGNYAKAINANGLPANGKDVDTYFDINPGDHLTLPDATIIESVQDGPLLQATDQGLQYVHKEAYSQHELNEMDEMARQLEAIMPGGVKSEYDHKDLPAEKMRLLALAKAVHMQGGKRLVGVGSHYTNDRGFQQAYDKMNAQLGVAETALHLNTRESYFIDDIAAKFANGSATEFAPGHKETGLLINVENIPLQAMRTIIASGFLPARPMQHSPEDRMARKQADSFGLLI